MWQDCEGCEFYAVPAMQDMLGSKTRVFRFSGELHLSVTNGHEKSEARKVEQELVKATQNLFTKRGCSWTPVFNC